MGDFEDFFEDDDILDEQEALEKPQAKDKTVATKVQTSSKSEQPDENNDEDLAPGMIDLEALESTGGYSFDDEPDEEEPLKDSSLSDDIQSNHDIDLNEIDLKPSDLSQNNPMDESATETYHHFEEEQEGQSTEYAEEFFEATSDEKPESVKSSHFKLSEEEKNKKIDQALDRSSSTIHEKEIQVTKSEHKLKDDGVFINLDENELFSDVIIDKLDDASESGIDIDEPASVQDNHESYSESKPINASTAKGSDFEAFEAFLKNNREDHEGLDLSDNDGVEEDIKIPAPSRFQLPQWLEKVSLPKIPLKLIVLVLVMLSLVVAYVYRQPIERVVFNRIPYTAPSEMELQQISVILSKANQEVLFDHLVAQRKAIVYFDESLKIDSRHLQTLYLKSIVQAQILLDDSILASKSDSEGALSVLGEFYPQTIEFQTSEAYFLLAAGDVEQSVKQFKQLKSINPDDVYISMGFAEALAIQKKYDQAYQAVSLIKTGHRRTHYLKAFILDQLQSKRAYEVYLASLGASNMYHPKLEYLKLQVNRSQRGLTLDELKTFDLNLRKNILKFPKVLLKQVYLTMAEVYLENQATEQAVIALKNSTKNSDDDQVFFKMALLQDQLGDLKSAVQSYAQAYKSVSENEKYFLHYLNALRRSEKLKTALQLADEKSESYLKSVDFLYEYALIKENLLRTDEAIAHLQQAKTLDSKNLRYDEALVSIYMSKDDYESAYQVSNDILKSNPKNELALLYKAKILTDYHVFSSAKNTLEEISQPIQNDYLLYDVYVDYWIKTKNFNELEILIEKIKKSDLNGYQKDLLISKHLIAMNKNQTAIEHLQPHRLKDAKDINVNVLLAKAHFQDENPPKAIEILDESMQVNRSHYETLLTLGKALVASGQLSLGIERLGSARDIRPKVPQVSYELFKAYIASDNPEKVEQYFQETIEKDPNFLLAYSMMAQYYFDSNLYSKAKPVYAKVIQLNPKDENAFLNLGIIEKFNRNIIKSKEYFRKVITLNKRNAQAYIALGILEEEGRDIRSAQRNFEMAKQVDPKNPEPYYLLGLLYRQLGRYQAALDHFDMYLNMKPDSKDREMVEDQIDFLRKRGN